MSHRALPFPEDSYLLALARFFYAVSYLEWTVLGDLSHISGLPIALQVQELAGKTTGTIGRQLANPVLLAQVADPVVRAWLAAGGDHLIEVAKVRNSVLHARPATVDGRQRLHRWDPSRGEVFTITEPLLTEMLDDISNRVRDMSNRRIIAV
jgi:hypothetical protein